MQHKQQVLFQIWEELMLQLIKFITFLIMNHQSMLSEMTMKLEAKRSESLTCQRSKVKSNSMMCGSDTHFVLRGLNLKINPQESCALVGESGCGKSTFINLVMRFYDPAHGKITLDGTDITTINLHDLRTAVSLVMQEPNIFNYNVMENILYGKLDATNSQILAAAELSNCVEFIDKKQA
jgi:ABC-type multidrug transport system fused ATPase/permease subunit